MPRRPAPRHASGRERGQRFMMWRPCRCCVDRIDAAAASCSRRRGSRIDPRARSLSERGRRWSASAALSAASSTSRCSSALRARGGDTAEGVESSSAVGSCMCVGERLDFTHEQTREVAYAALLRAVSQRLPRPRRRLEACHGSDAESHALSLAATICEQRWQAAHRYLAQAGKSAGLPRRHREPRRASTCDRRPGICSVSSRGADHHLCFDIRSPVCRSATRAGARKLRIAEEEAEAIGDRTRSAGRTPIARTLVHRRRFRGLSMLDSAASRSPRRCRTRPSRICEHVPCAVAHWVGDYRQRPSCSAQRDDA